jgi:hypothetical protein
MLVNLNPMAMQATENKKENSTGNRLEAFDRFLKSENDQRREKEKLTLPPPPKKSEEQLKREAEAKAKIEAEKEGLAKELYEKCSKNALDNLKLAEDLRPLISNDKLIGTDKTFCIVGYIYDPDKSGKKVEIAFFGTKLDYISSKNEPFHQRDPLDVKDINYQFDFSDFNVKNFINSSEKAVPSIKPLDKVDYMFKVKESFSDKTIGYKFPSGEDVRKKFSLDANTILIEAEPSDTYTRFSITGPTKKYAGKEGGSLLDGGHVEYFWGTIKTPDGREINIGEQKIYGAKLLEAKSDEAVAEPKE